MLRRPKGMRAGSRGVVLLGTLIATSLPVGLAAAAPDDPDETTAPTVVDTTAPSEPAAPVPSVPPTTTTPPATVDDPDPTAPPETAPPDTTPPPARHPRPRVRRRSRPRPVRRLRRHPTRRRRRHPHPTTPPLPPARGRKGASLIASIRAIEDARWCVSKTGCASSTSPSPTTGGTACARPTLSPRSGGDTTSAMTGRRAQRHST